MDLPNKKLGGQQQTSTSILPNYKIERFCLCVHCTEKRNTNDWNKKQNTKLSIRVQTDLNEILFVFRIFERNRIQ